MKSQEKPPENSTKPQQGVWFSKRPGTQRKSQNMPPEINTKPQHTNVAEGHFSKKTRLANQKSEEASGKQHKVATRSFIENE